MFQVYTSINPSRHRAPSRHSSSNPRKWIAHQQLTRANCWSVRHCHINIWGGQMLWEVKWERLIKWILGPWHVREKKIQFLCARKMFAVRRALSASRASKKSNKVKNIFLKKVLGGSASFLRIHRRGKSYANCQIVPAATWAGPRCVCDHHRQASMGSPRRKWPLKVLEPAGGKREWDQYFCHFVVLIVR